MFRNSLLLACATFALAACTPMVDENGDGIADGTRAPDTTSLIAPSNPVGTISGVVVNSNQAPIEGVNVTLVLGDGTDASHVRKGVTNGEGAFVFKDVPAGADGQLLMAKTGYSNARLSTSVPGNAGNFPINDGNANVGVVTLGQLSSTVKFRVYTASGRPAKGAKGYLEVRGTAFRTAAGVYGNAVGNYSGAADVDENGVLSFTNAPDTAELARIGSAQSSFDLTIGALDEDGDMVLDALGTTATYTPAGLFTNPERTLILPSARTNATLAILASNVESFGTPAPGTVSPPYRNAVKANDAINIVFNQAITQADTTRLVKVVQEDCETNVAVSVTQRAPNVLSIAPAAAWTLGNRYNIIVRVTGLEDGTTSDFVGYFFAIDATVPRPLSTSGAFQVHKASTNMMNNALQPGDTFHVVFDTPVTFQTGGGFSAYALVNTDLNGDSMTGGTTLGEFNNTINRGFAVSIDEPLRARVSSNGTFACKASTYSTRWSITVPLASFPSAGFIQSNTGMKIVFPKDNSSADTYQTAWGSPVGTDVTGTINVIP